MRRSRLVGGSDGGSGCGRHVHGVVLEDGLVDAAGAGLLERGERRGAAAVEGRGAVGVVGVAAGVGVGVGVGLTKWRRESG